MRERTKKELDDLRKKIILMIYYQFCYKQRSQEMWDAGFEVMNKL